MKYSEKVPLKKTVIFSRFTDMEHHMQIGIW